MKTQPKKSSPEASFRKSRAKALQALRRKPDSHYRARIMVLEASELIEDARELLKKASDEHSASPRWAIDDDAVGLLDDVAHELRSAGEGLKDASSYCLESAAMDRPHGARRTPTAADRLSAMLFELGDRLDDRGIGKLPPDGFKVAEVGEMLRRCSAAIDALQRGEDPREVRRVHVQDVGLTNVRDWLSALPGEKFAEVREDLLGVIEATSIRRQLPVALQLTGTHARASA
jgi:hypothetical protein